jgi:hypothetical protein
MLMGFPASGWAQFKERRYTTMTYSKPEIAVLGDAVRLIEGSKSSHSDTIDPNDPLGVDYELQD